MEKYDPDDEMPPQDITLCRSALGKLNWITTQTRPDLTYDVSELSSALNKKQVKTLIDINKAIRKAKRYPSKIVIPDLGNLEKCKMLVYCDASFANLSNGGSQGGYVVFLVGENKKAVPIAWSSHRLKRVVKSTHAAETLALVDGVEAAIFYRKFLLDLLSRDNYTIADIPIECKTDSRAAYQAAYSSTQILDKRLRIETAIVREMLERGTLATLDWVPTDEQLADCLTKRGVMPTKILGHFGDPETLLE